MRINTNMAALNAWRALTVNNENMTKSLEKLSSGYRVNRAADDAAGLAVSEKMRAQIRGINMAIRNAQDGISLIQTAEGGASQIQAMVQRMRELAVQASNGTLTPEDRQQLQEEFQQLQDEVTRTATTTTFNTLSLLHGGVSFVPPANQTDNETLISSVVFNKVPDTGIVFGVFTVEVTTDDTSNPAKYTVTVTSTTNENEKYSVDITDPDVTAVTIDDLGITINFAKTISEVGANADLGTVKIEKEATEIALHVGPNQDTIKVKIDQLSAEALNIDKNTINIKTSEDAEQAIVSLDEAIKTINSARAKLGAYQNRLENAIGTLRIQSENLTAAESRIRDVDMAQEMANFTKYQILQQASTAMLAQANMSTQSILSLLR